MNEELDCATCPARNALEEMEARNGTALVATILSFLIGVLLGLAVGCGL